LLGRCCIRAGRLIGLYCIVAAVGC